MNCLDIFLFYSVYMYVSYIQSDRFFYIKSVGHPQIGPHILRNTDR